MIIFTLKSVQASWSWAAWWFLCMPTRTHKQHTGTLSSMQKSLSSSRCSLHFRDSRSPVTSTTVCSLRANLCWCSRAWAWHSEASQVRQVFMATDGISMQWSQWIVEHGLVDLVKVVVCSSDVDGLLVKSFTLVWRLVFTSRVRSEGRKIWHSGQKKGPSLDTSVSQTAWMQVRQKSCPHGSVTGYVKKSWQTGHFKASSTVPIALLAPVVTAQCALCSWPFLLINVSQASFGMHAPLMCPSVRLLKMSWYLPVCCFKPLTLRRPNTIEWQNSNTPD